MATEIGVCVLTVVAINLAAFAIDEAPNPLDYIRSWIRETPGFYAGLALGLVALTRRGLARIGGR